MIYRELGEFPKALKCLQNAIGLYESYFQKENNLNSAFCLTNLGAIYKLAIYYQQKII